MKKSDVIVMGTKRIDGYNVVTVKDPFSNRVKNVRQTELNKAIKAGRVTVIKSVSDYKTFRNAVNTINRRLKQYELAYGRASKPYQSLASKVGALNQHTKSSRGINYRLSTSKELFEALKTYDYNRNVFIGMTKLPNVNELNKNKYADILRNNNLPVTKANIQMYAQVELNMESEINRALSYVGSGTTPIATPDNNGLSQEENKWIRDTMYYPENGGKRTTKRISLAQYNRLIELGKKAERNYAENANVISDPFSV